MKGTQSAQSWPESGWGVAGAFTAAAPLRALRWIWTFLKSRAEKITQSSENRMFTQGSVFSSLRTRRKLSCARSTSGLVYGYRTRYFCYLYFLPGSVVRLYILRLILSACRSVWFSRFRRLRVKNLHNFKSKKSRIDLWGVKLQHKVPSIFVRD